MEGYVNANPREPRLPVKVLRPDGTRLPLDFTVDTGFTGFMTLPPELVREFQLPYIQETEVTLADGSSVASRVYVATIMWHGVTRRTLVHSIPGSPTLGMSLLWNSDVAIAARAGGRVVVSESAGAA